MSFNESTMTSLIEESGDLINASCDDLYSKDKTVLFSSNHSNNHYTTTSNNSSSNLNFSNHSASCGLSANKALYSSGALSRHTQQSSNFSNYNQHPHHQHFHNHLQQPLHPFSSSSLSSSPSSSVSSTSSALSYGSRNESNSGKSEYHIVGGKIRPTLKCIRNTLNLGIDSIKRYDRLSSSKCDINDLNCTEFASSPSTIDEEPISCNILHNNNFSDDCCFAQPESTSLFFNTEFLTEIDTTKDVIVNPLANCIPNIVTSNCTQIGNNNNSTIQSSVSSTNNTASTTVDNLAQISDPNATTSTIQQLPTAATNTFRSFIKTKSTKGIMLRKDSCNEDDDEVVKLCDVDNNDEGISSKVSSESDLTYRDPFEQLPTSHKFSGKSKQMSSAVSNQQSKHSSNRSTSKTASSGTSSSSHHPQCSRSYSQSSNSRHHHQLVNGSSSCTNSKCYPGGQCCLTLQQSTSTLPAENNSSNSSSKKQYNNGKNVQKISNQTKASSFSSASLSSQTSHYPNCQNPSPQKRSSRTNLIPPLLKSSRFTKNSSSTSSKGNLLFNAISHRSSHKGSNLSKPSPKKHHNVGNIHDTSREVVESLKSDRMVVTQPDEDRRRRTIIIEKQNNSFGFTLQTYGIKHSKEGEVELITYVDEVAYGGPAFRGGMRPGDVILSINGRDVEKADHRTLVNFISACEKTMRLVVLFEDCVRKIELHLKFIKLKKSLQQRMAQLEILNQKENQLLLNAAARSCHEKNNGSNNNAVAIQNNSGTAFVQSSKDDFFESSANPGTNLNYNNGQLKKYKCKSLEISLDEINCNNSGNSDGNACKTFCGDKWNFDGDSTTNTVCSGDNCFGNCDKADQFHHSTTLPRTNNASTDSNGANLLDGFPTCPIASESITDAHLFQQQQNRSKSLPQSMANSLDCLTNEAYEDDEDVLIDNSKDNIASNVDNARGSHDQTTWSDDHTGCLTFCNDSTTFTEPQKHRTIIFEQTQKISNKKSQHHSITSDKDFITKL